MMAGLVCDNPLRTPRLNRAGVRPSSIDARRQPHLAACRLISAGDAVLSAAVHFWCRSKVSAKVRLGAWAADPVTRRRCPLRGRKREPHYPARTLRTFDGAPSPSEPNAARTVRSF